MSSSPISSSSSEPEAAVPGPFDALADVPCPVAAVLGTGTFTVRDCLALGVGSVLVLQQSAGEDLILTVNGITLARGEVVIVDDSAALRVTEISLPAPARAVA
jgi:flagellar motor switch protein FliN/FliY